MTTERKQRLGKTVADLQQRFGRRAISRAADAPPVPVLATGFPALDDALGVGGLPRGRISEIAGVPTSGMVTLALRLIAQAQQETTASMAAYLDVDKTFDPDYAARCGVELARLMIVRPTTLAQAVGMLPDFVATAGFSVLVVDSPPQLLGDDLAELLGTTLSRLVAPLSRSGCVLVFLSGLPPGSPLPDAYPRGGGLAHYAAVRLLIWRERWLYHQRDVTGYEAQVAVVKNRLAAEGGRATVALDLRGL